MKFYKENNTNNIVTDKEIENYDNYTLIEANSVDAAIEKHVPTYEVKDNKLLVQVGSVEHPMTSEHYIMWIAQVDGDNIIKKELKPSDKPIAEFDYIKDSVIYAYCNLHGLWMKVVD